MVEVGQLFRFDGIEVTAYLTGHVLKRCAERRLTQEDVWGTITNAGETLIEAKEGEYVIVRDYLSGLTVLYSLEMDDLDILLHVVTVYDGTDQFRQAKDQSTIIVYPQLDENGFSKSEYFHKTRVHYINGQLTD